ncbi:MAG: hypothetical protein GYA33_11005 [Thermogutta sp.]|nr:hypothetical protein [Thermogutta sp.]
MTAVGCGRRMIVAAVLACCAGGTAYGQCLLSGLCNRRSTYAAQYGTYSTGYTAYMPVSAVPVTTYMPVTYAAPTVTYRAAYRPLAPSLGTTVFRPAPALAASPPPVVTPYAAASPVAAPTVVYRPVEVVVEPRRLFPWRPFQRWRARRTAYSVSYAAPTWTTTQFAGYSLPLTPAVCDPCASSLPSSYSSDTVITGSSGECATCGSSSTGLPLSAADAVPALPTPGGSSGSAASSQPQSTYAPSSSGDSGESWKPATSPDVQGTGLPRDEEERPLVRQAVFVRPIPLVEESTDAPPLVEIRGWKRN